VTPDNKEIEMNKDQLFDLLERAGWTLLQALAGFLVGYKTENIYLGLITAAVGSILKGIVAQQFGNGTAATLPATVEPVYTGDADLEWDVVGDEDIDAIDAIVDLGKDPGA
jgi:uncharacterized protein (DUF697 family)